MLKFETYDSRWLTWELTGKPLSGMFPWEIQWLINKGSGITGDILEIGTHKGATARELAVAFPHLTIHCVDSADASYGLKPEEIGMESKHLPNVSLTLADSKSYSFPPGLGMIIIDGDHSWDGVKADTEKSVNYFRNRSGLIVWHDYDPTHEVMPYLDWLVYHTGLPIKWVQNTMLAYL